MNAGFTDMAIVIFCYAFIKLLFNFCSSTMRVPGMSNTRC